MKVYPIITSAKMIKGKHLFLREVNEEDAEFIVRLRINKKKSRFIHPILNDVETQIKFIKDYKKSKGQAYFIICDSKKNPLGTVRMYDAIEDSFCWGSWVIIDNAPTTTAIESALIIYSYALKCGFRNSHFDVRKDNNSVINFHTLFGAKKIYENKFDYFFSINIESIIYGIKRYKKYLKNEIQIII